MKLRDKQTLMPEGEEEAEHRLFVAIAAIKTAEEACDFFLDLCTRSHISVKYRTVENYSGTALSICYTHYTVNKVGGGVYRYNWNPVRLSISLKILFKKGY